MEPKNPSHPRKGVTSRISANTAIMTNNAAGSRRTFRRETKTKGNDVTPKKTAPNIAPLKTIGSEKYLFKGRPYAPSVGGRLSCSMATNTNAQTNAAVRQSTKIAATRKNAVNLAVYHRRLAATTASNYCYERISGV